MINHLVLAILLLCSMGHTIRYEVHDMQAHFVTDEEYYKGLIDLQNKLIDSLAKVETEVKAMTTTVKTEGSTQGTSTTTLQARLTEEKDAIDKLENYIKVPLTPKPCNVSAQTISARDALKKKSNQVNTAVQDFKKELAACTKCTISNELNQAILQQQNYVSVVTEICDSNCCNTPKPIEPQQPSGMVDLSQNQYKNNLQAKNWVYGNITEEQYKYQVFADSIKYNQTTCPIEKPYVNPSTHNCFDCPSGMNFNLGKKTCETCPNNFTYNALTNQCQSPCKSDEFFNTTSGACQANPVNKTDSICPNTKPIWNSVNKICEACPRETPLYDTAQKKCVVCPANTTWNQQLQKCIPVCQAEQHYNSTTQQCQKKPQCENGTQWNNTSLKCESVCTNGTVFNNTSGKCEAPAHPPCDDLKPIWNQTIRACQICPEATPVWNKEAKKCEACPAATPVFDYSQQKCVQKICDAGYKWNKDKLKCTSLTGNCSKDEAFVFETESCVKKCQANQTYYPENDTCSCLPEKPVFNKTTRVCEEKSCPEGQKWNIKLLSCTALNGTCEVSQIYSFDEGKCIDKCQPNTPYIAANDSCQCPADRPHFNKENRKCEIESCSSGYQWNTNLKKCSPTTKNCSDWQVYNFTTEQCVNKCEVNHTYIKQTDQCKCPAEYPRFDRQTRTCMTPICPENQIWNKYLLKCSYINKTCEKWEMYDFKTQNCVVKCEVNQTYFEKYDNCTCPIERPFYNTTSKKCTEPVCPAGYKYNPALAYCGPLTMTCDKWQLYNFTSGSCEQKCEENQTYYKDNDTCTCPPERPFYNTTSKSCTIPPCGNGTKWNPDLKKCTLLDQKCEIWQLYSFEEGKCLDKCQVNYTYFKQTDTCSCPAETPQYDKKTKKCVEPVCPEGYLWNKLLIKCSEVKKNCSAWQTYNFATETCDDKCEKDVTYNRREDKCECPPERPLFDNTTRKCLVPNCSAGYQYNKDLVKCSSIKGNCRAWQVYNFTNEQCITKCQENITYIKESDSCACPPEKAAFDPKTRKCAEPVCPVGYQWNPHLIKCSPIEGNCQKWQSYNITLQSCLDVCEMNHTYFKQNNTCECFPQAPTFDNKTRKCVIPTCPNGTEWNKVLNKCSPLKGQCSAWELYNFTTEKCDTKCKVNQQYHPTTNSCQCSPEFPLFDSKTDQCIEPPCPSGFKWNKYLTKCSPLTKPCQKWEFYDFASENCVSRCQKNHTYYKQNDTCQCFPEKPIFNKATRVCEIPICQPETKWNAHLKKCSFINGNCQRWQLYNFTDETCIDKCDKFQTYYANNDTCHCYPADPIYNRVTRKCEQPVCTDGRYWDRKVYRCMCKDNLVFNQTSKKCEVQCKPGEFFNETSKKCQFITVPPRCGQFMFVNASNKCQCLAGYVYAEGGQYCRLDCTSGYRYNAQTKRCEQIVCPPKYTFNSATQKCEKNQLICPQGFFWNEGTRQCLSCPAGFTYNAATNQCEASTHYICPSGYFFNTETKLCDPITSNCAAGQWYDNSTNKCMPLHITSPQAANLLSSNMTEYNSYYIYQKKINTRLTDCVAPTAFYDKNTFTCISCPSTQPYFNLDFNRCESCGSLIYNSTTFRCVVDKNATAVTIDPTIGRFIMNVI